MSGEDVEAVRTLGALVAEHCAECQLLADALRFQEQSWQCAVHERDAAQAEAGALARDVRRLEQRLRDAENARADARRRARR